MSITPTIPGAFVVQSQGPDEPVFILGPDPQNRFIARMEEGTIEDAKLLAASRQMRDLLNCALFKMNNPPTSSLTLLSRELLIEEIRLLLDELYQGPECCDEPRGMVRGICDHCGGTVQSQGPDEPVFILGPEPQNRIIARMEEGTIEDAKLLAGSRGLLTMLRRLLDEVCLTEAGMSHITPLTLEHARAAISNATNQP